MIVQVVSGQPRPTRSRSISVLTPADLPERGSPRAAALPHPSIRPTTHPTHPTKTVPRENLLLSSLTITLSFSLATWRPLRPLLTPLLTQNLLFLSSPFVSWLQNELESPYPEACTPPRALRDTVRATEQGWGSTTKESSFHFSLDKEMKEEKE